MKLNDDKFEVLRYGTNNDLEESTTYTTPKGLPIETKTEVKDLGVVMSDENKFNEQIDDIYKIKKHGILDTQNLPHKIQSTNADPLQVPCPPNPRILFSVMVPIVSWKQAEN